MPVPRIRTDAEPPCSVRNCEVTSAPRGHPRVRGNPEYPRPLACGPRSSPSSPLLWVPLVAGRTTIPDRLPWAASPVPTVKLKVGPRQEMRAGLLPAVRPAAAAARLADRRARVDREAAGARPLRE